MSMAILAGMPAIKGAKPESAASAVDVAKSSFMIAGDSTTR